MRNRTNVLLWPVALVGTFFSRDEKVLSDEYALRGGYCGQYLIARVFTRRARESTRITGEKRG